MRDIQKIKIDKPMPGIASIVFLALVLNTAQVSADSLENLRASGAIGESYDGYVVAKEPGAQAEANEINAKRRTIYQEKAAAQGVPVEQVGKVYAAEIIKKVPPGTWIQLNGQWKQKE